MRRTRLALTGALCVLGALAAGAPAAQAAPAPVTVPAGVSATDLAPAQGCYIRFYFLRDTNILLRPNAESAILGLGLRGGTFDYQNRSENGFWYGRDVRSGGKTGWVRADNMGRQRVCD